MDTEILKIAIISDTHMRLSESAQNAIAGNFDESQIYEQVKLDARSDSFLAGVSLQNLFGQTPKLILHAGDIGQQLIIDILESIAPVRAVNGNCDFSDFKTMDGFTRDFEYFEFEGVRFGLAHVPSTLDFALNGSFMHKPEIGDAPLPDVAIHGHTHLAEILLPKTEDNNNPYVQICPGSATQGRYGSPNSVALLYICKQRPILAQLVEV